MALMEAAGVVRSLPLIPAISAPGDEAVDWARNLKEADSRRLGFPNSFLPILKLAIKHNILSEDQQGKLANLKASGQILEASGTKKTSFIHQRRRNREKRARKNIGGLSKSLLESLEQASLIKRQAFFDRIKESASAQESPSTPEQNIDSDIQAFFSGFRDLQVVDVKAYLDPSCADIVIDTRLRDDVKLRIHYVTHESSSLAMAALEAFLDIISRPLDDVFHQEDITTGPGYAKLISDGAHDHYFALCVCHNVFFRVESRKLYGGEAQQIASSLTNGLFKHIYESAKVGKQARFPRVTDIPPEKTVVVGETFTVSMRANDLQYYYQAYSTTGKVSCIKSGTTEIEYKFTFSADQTGEDTLIFCFAHHLTMNFFKLERRICVSKPEKSDLLRGQAAKNSEHPKHSSDAVQLDASFFTKAAALPETFQLPPELGIFQKDDIEAFEKMASRTYVGDGYQGNQNSGGARYLEKSVKIGQETSP